MTELHIGAELVQRGWTQGSLFSAASAQMAFLARSAPKEHPSVVKLYIRRWSDAYRSYLEQARRFLDAPEGSEEEALARAELEAALPVAILECVRDRSRAERSQVR